VIRSMTGFGMAQATYHNTVVCVEVSTFNSRYLSLHTRTPDLTVRWCPEIEKLLRGKIARGTVKYLLRLSSDDSKTAYSLDEELLADLHKRLTSVAERLGVRGELPLTSLAALPGVIQTRETREEVAEEMWPLVKELTLKAMEHLVSMRTKEGQSIERDFFGRLDVILRLLDQLQEKVPAALEAIHTRLYNRIVELLKDVDITLDPAAVIRESAFYVEKADISEEATRLRSHVHQFREALKAEDAVGRRLEFLCQEMVREADTMSAKTQDLDLSQIVLDIKVEVNKIREQAFNVE